MSMLRFNAAFAKADVGVEQQGTGLLPPTMSQRGEFSTLYRQTNAEVLDYIKRGTNSNHTLTALTPEGAWAYQRARSMLPAVSETGPPSVKGNHQQAFLASIAPYAREAATKLGVAPHIIAAHAALESSWGQRPLTDADGINSYNLFGIKAGGNWQGDVVAALTTEYVDTASVKRTERFRAYPGFQAAFTDYVDLMTGNRRFHGALGAGSDALAFAQALARGGYATDPNYAGKLARVAASIPAI